MMRSYHQTQQRKDAPASNHHLHETTGTQPRKKRRTEVTPATEAQLASPRRTTRRKASPLQTQPSTASAFTSADSLDYVAISHDAPVDPQLKTGEGRLPAVGGLSIQKVTESARHNGSVRSSTAQGQAMLTEANPDLATVISNIIEHGETIDSHYAAHGLNELGIVDTESFRPLGASMHLKTQSLPILENLAIQILNTLAKSTYQEVLTIATDPDSEAGQAYNTLKSLFDHTKKVYSIHEPFLLPGELGFTDPAHINTIRKANLATFVSSVFGSYDVGFYHLNEYFLDTFVGDSNRLLKSQAQLFLDLKTQAFISAQGYGQVDREKLLEDLFPANLEERLLARKAGSAFVPRQLAPSETDFLQRARNRSKALAEESESDDPMTFLTQKYVWEDFLRDISAYMRKPSQPGRSAFYHPGSNDGAVDEPNQKRHSNGQVHPESGLQAQTEGSTSIMYQAETQDTREHATAAKAAEANQAAKAAMQGFGFHQGISMPFDHEGPEQQNPLRPQISVQQQLATPQPSNGIQQSPMQYPPPPAVQYHFEHHPTPHVFFHQGNQFPPHQNTQAQLNQTPVDMNIQQQFYGDQPSIPFPTQSAPTQVLYERARMAATAKVSPSNRRAGTPSQRRPWSAEEENALMAGLDRVKGPHWSQILAMFGPGGTINETLKDRNQVQLKDKARNLKLFFLKSGIEVPYYLQFVTGELKTRAPAQAAKNEAKEREKDSEERAHVEGVMALAGVHETAATRGNEYSNAGFDPVDGGELGDQELDLESVQARMDAFDEQHQQAYQPTTQPPAAAVLPSYNHEVTPAFQAMIDAAAAEAARVDANGG
ncbi:MAG: hypothetical protein Q9191_003214 [Dirinaria sp. TL-2023a]